MTRKTIAIAVSSIVFSFAAFGLSASAQPQAPEQGMPAPKEAPAAQKPDAKCDKPGAPCCCCCCCCCSDKAAKCDPRGDKDFKCPQGPQDPKDAKCQQGPQGQQGPQCHQDHQGHKGHQHGRPGFNQEQDSAFRAAFIPEPEFKALSADKQKEVLAKQKALLDEMDAKAEEARTQREKELKQLEKDWKKFDKLTVEEQQELIKKKMQQPCPMR